MAEKTIVVDIDIKAEDIRAANDAMAQAAKSSAMLTVELNKLKEDQKQNNKLYKEGAISATELAARQAGLKLKMTEVSKQLSQSNKEYATNKTVVDAATGSNEQLRARLSLLTKQYNGLSKEQRENSKTGKQMEATIKTITDKLKANEKAVGDNRRNVGNYEEALKGVAGQINVMGVNLGGLANQLKTYKEGVIASTAATKASATGTGLFSTALNVLKLAIIGTGIGALVIALGSLVTFFTQTKRGAELLSQGLSAIGATVSVLTDRMSQLGEALTMVFDGEFTKAAEQAKGAFGGITEEIVKESKAAANLEKQMQKLRDRERDLTVEISKRKAEVAALQLLAEDETKSNAVRLEAIRKANAIQLDQQEKELALQREKVRITEEQLALGENLEEDENRLAQERAKLGEIEAANLKKLRTLKAKENSIVKQEQAQLIKRENEKRKLTEDQIKAEEAAEQKRAAVREQFRVSQLTELQRRKENAYKQANILREAGEEEKAIEQFLSKELIEINRQEQDDILNAKLKRYEEEATVAKAKIESEIQDAEIRKAAILQIDADLAAAKQQELDLEIMNYTASTEMMGFVDQERNAKLIEQKTEVDAQIVELDRQKTEQLKAHEDELAAKRRQEQQNYTQAATASLGTVGNILSGFSNQIQQNIKQTEEQAKAAGKTDEQIAAMTKERRKEAHELAVAAAIVQTLQAAIAAYQSGASIPIVGVALGPIMAAAALAFGFAQVGQMKKEKFADGGIAQGPSHAQGGIPFTVAGHGGYEMEGNEIILTKGVYQDPQLRQQASILNQLGGGKALTTGTYMAQGGIASPTFAARQATNSNTQALEAQISQLGDRIETMQPVVRVTDINRINRQSVKVQQSADL